MFFMAKGMWDIADSTADSDSKLSIKGNVQAEKGTR